MTHSVVIIGLGRIGMGYDLVPGPAERVHSHSRAFSEHPAFSLLAAVDPEPTRRARFEAAYGRPAYRDVEVALAANVAEIVVIATPTVWHRDTLFRVLDRARPRAIVCEKPLANSVADATAMVETCATNGVGLYVNYVRRSDPGVIEIKRRLAAGTIETPLKGVAWYSNGFRHSGSHLFNLLEYWLGPMERARIIDAGRRAHVSDAEPDVAVRFAAGAVVFLAAREEAFSHHAIDLVASNGRLRYDRGGAEIEWAELVVELEGTTLAKPEPIASGMARYQWHVAEQLALALDGGPASLCSAAEALTTLSSVQSILAMRDANDD